MKICCRVFLIAYYDTRKKKTHTEFQAVSEEAISSSAHHRGFSLGNYPLISLSAEIVYFF
jgi:hypothetical protein